MTTVSVVIPTVAGREASLKRTRTAYLETRPDGVALQLIVMRDRPTCGHAWAQGVEVATGDLLHITADDLEPHPGWLEAGMACLETGAIPSPWIDLPWGGTDGEVGGDGHPARMTPIPLMPREWWPGVPPIGYWSDYALSDRLLAADRRIVWCHAYRFTHWRVQDAARARQEARFGKDMETYQQDQAVPA